MRYVNFESCGGPEVLTVCAGPEPQPAAGEVRISVAYAGVNRPDILQRQGLYPAPPEASPILGLEVSGTIDAIGASVSGFELGQNVCALTNGGGYAEKVCVPAGQCFIKPQALDFACAAALPEALLTSWVNVFSLGRLASGETLLVQGGSGGIGHIVVQMALYKGATVIATAGSEEKCKFLERLGVHRAINYKTEDFVQVVRDEFKGADLVLDMVGGDYVQKHIKVARPDGRIINIAFQSGSQVSLDLTPMMLKRLTLTGSTLRARTETAKGFFTRQALTAFGSALEDGSVRPIVTDIFALDKVVEAHSAMNTGVSGKIVLQVLC